MALGHKPPHDDEDLALTRTKLSVVDGEMQRLNWDNRMLLRLPLSEMERIQLRRTFDWRVFPFAATGIAIGLVGYFVSENNVLSVILYVIGILLIGIGGLGSYGVAIDVTTRDGVTAIPCFDSLDRCECFVTSVRQMMRDRKAPRTCDDPDESSTAFREAT